MGNIPVTFLTGFLGSGKSTLLTQILSDPRFGNTAVVVNEFGDVGLDGLLIEHAEDQLVEMTSGCLCCTIRGDIRETLLGLHARRDKGEIPAFTRLVIESTGLADPAPVIHTLMTDPRVNRRYMLGGIVATVDAVNGAATLAAHPECTKQAAVADRLVVTKTDLIGDQNPGQGAVDLVTRLRALNPGAPILERRDPAFDLDRLFDTSLYDPATKTMDVRRWLNAEAEIDDTGHHHKHDHPHDHGEGEAHHDVTRHGADIRSFTLTFDEPLPIEAFGSAVESLVMSHGENLLRIKGLVNAADRPGRPLVIHGVQHVFHDPVWLDAWPGDDRRTRLVFITRGIPRKTLEDFFAIWIGLEREN